MTKRLLSILLTLCLMLTLIPVSAAGTAYAADEPTEQELNRIFTNMGFASQLKGGDPDFDEDENVSPYVALWFISMNGRLEKYYNEETWNYEMTIDQYMDVMNSSFTNYDEEEVKAFLEENGYYDSSAGDDVTIFLGGLGDYWAWEPLTITQFGNEYIIEGIFLYGGEATGDVTDDDIEFYDYWLYSYSYTDENGEVHNCTDKMAIEHGITVTVVNTDEGLKVSSYDETPCYTWDGVTYAQNESTGEFDQTYTATLAYTSATYSGSNKKPAVTVTDKDGNVLASSQYEVEYAYNKNPGTAKVEIEVDYGNYDAEILKTFKIKLKAPAVSTSNVTSSGKIKLSWSAVSKADTYYIYRATSKNGTYSRIKTTTSTSYTDTTAVAEKTYYYKVKSVYAADSAYNSAYSTVVSRTCDLKQVTGLKAATVASSGKIKLTWSGVSGADKYYVYRATSKNGTYKQVKTTTNKYWTDTTAVAEKTYYYKVKAVSTANSAANGAFSSKVSKVCDLAKPVISVSRNSSGDPKVTWKKVTGADKYYVYRATSKSGTYKKVKTTTNKYWTDTTAVAGKTYYYKVKAVSTATSDANSAFSAVKNCTAK